MKRIHKVAVLGAGTMGARIAAHFANAGVPSYLLDIVPPDSDGPARNRIAAAGVEAAKKSKPAAFYEPALARLVTVGNFEDDLKRLSEVDWIIEAVVENLEIKRTLLKRVEAIRKPGTIVSTNTSGLPVAKIAEGFSDDFRKWWLGTHFFNPPRYMRLLEIIATLETDHAAIEAVTHFSDVNLGKGVVFAKDTPNFIANRIGTFSVLNVMRLMQEMDLSIEDVDALTGDAVGWPKSATFRTIDLVGLDILGHVVGNMEKSGGQKNPPNPSPLPDFYKQMLERKWLGDKTKGGFYKKVWGGRPRPPTPAKNPARKKNASRWIGSRSHIALARSRSSLLSTWQRISRTRRRDCACCSASKEARRRETKRARSCGQSCPISGTILPTGYQKSPTPSWRSIVPCASASTGSWGPSNCGTQPGLRPPWRV